MKLSARLMKSVFFSVQEVEESTSWRALLEDDDRAPKKVHTGRAYLVLLGTMLDAGRRAEMVRFEKIFIRYMDETLVNIPALEKGRLWRILKSKMQFVHA